MTASTRRALITGISGQDGTLLAELLANKGWQVFGISRREPSARVKAVASVTVFDVCDTARLRAMLRDVVPHHCYHLAAHHRSSQAVRGVATTEADADEQRVYLNSNLMATAELLAQARIAAPECRIFLAGSCHIFGAPTESPQNEATPFLPNSTYGLTKLAALHLGRLYREKHATFCCTGILFNHESPLRSDAFVTAKIARAAVEILRGQRSELMVGALDAAVDWGSAADYVAAMSAMLEARAPADYVISSGASHRVRDFVRIAFAHLGLDWTQYVREDPSQRRGDGPVGYFGDPSHIARDLGWRAMSPFQSLVEQMVDFHRNARAGNE